MENKELKQKKKYSKEYYLEKSRKSNYKKQYNITIQEYDFILSQQGGVCAICERPEKNGKRLAVDHCHKDLKVRGLLCSRCNLCLGLMEDNKEFISNMLAYLTWS